MIVLYNEDGLFQLQDKHIKHESKDVIWQIQDISKINDNDYLIFYTRDGIGGQITGDFIDIRKELLHWEIV